MAYVNEPIAVIGSGCRFPGGASSPSKLWDLLKSPSDVSRKIDRFNCRGFYHKDGSHHGTSNVLHSYLLDEDPRLFDAQFFNIPGPEADAIDPQQRLLMEVVYEALESSSHTIEELSGSPTSVYVGVMCNDYAHITYHDLESLPKYAATGSALSILSNRISYFFNWTGPSMTIDTACSSSMYATHSAVQSLRKGESDLAVAAGSNLIFAPTNYVAESNVSMLSPTGRSRMWDAKADGYARGEGVAAIILKRLSDAIFDGDNIDFIIRETGVNQDGRTPGITMPSSTSQAQLIRQTYERAGLSTEKDRCQYFEAHGTGTKAGDPQEAGAIYQAFFGNKENRKHDEILYVGSTKTVIGHTEGTAGIAGLLRASLAMQHGIIPPNMHFDEINPDVEPYYGSLQILTAAKPWPDLPPGIPRRASVNSFGFGGANAHAIIETYVPETGSAVESRSSTTAMPFLFSAYSEKTLSHQVESYLSYLEDLDENSTNLRDLAWTLSHRSAFSLRTCYSAHSLDTLRTKLRAALDAKKDEGKALGVRPSHKTRTLLGIFTGQGAQWPRMGQKLIESSPFAAALIDRLDEALQALPEQDRPAWSLKEEISKPEKSTRVWQGEYSQPLCAAVQILLVDLLGQAGVSFDVVVGHSSGEIGAAYAAGFLNARDAIRIAYYRGLFGKLARDPNGKSGTMLAVGTSMDDAQELCKLITMKKYGRFNVAASNSSASVTLSGDQTAIDRAKLVFEDEGKFARALKVDTAYHSHHMESCSEPYIEAMGRVNIEIQPPNASCRWYSSVLGGDLVTAAMSNQLRGSYWRDNLIQPVLFSQALKTALEISGAPALALELGPHPALKGPASLVIEESLGAAVPYAGVLAKHSDDLEAFSDAIGAVWVSLGAPKLSFGRLDTAFVSKDLASLDKPHFLRSMPGYVWDHSQIFWAESRISRAMRLRQDEHHELLGVRLDSADNELRWRNLLKPSEIPWVRGHSIQDQTVFPGAGFVALAIEATKTLARDSENDVELIELENLTIRRALGFPDETFGAEILVTLNNIERHDAAGVILCDFVCGSCATKDAAPTAISTAHIKLTLGQGCLRALPPREPASSANKMTDVDIGFFYESLAKLGYNYAGIFKGITKLRRRRLASSGVIHIKPDDGLDTDMTVHPAPLDVAFQGLLSAIGAPGDGQLWTLMVPTVIRSITVNPFTCNNTGGLATEVLFDAKVQVIRSSQDVSGDIDMYDKDGNSMVQIEGLQVTPLTKITAKDDAQKFAETIWAPEKPDATRGFTEFWNLEPEVWNKSYFVERTCFFYMKRLHDAIPVEEREALEWHPKKYLSWVTSVVDAAIAGTHPTVQKEWLYDTPETMEAPIREFTEQWEDLHIATILGDNMVPWVRGEISLLELFRGSDMLDHVYRTIYGVPQYNGYLGSLVEQLAHKAKQMEILEIGAGTGSATEAIMSRIADNFGSYTYTDISASFFPAAQDTFKDQDAKFIYKILDIETPPAEQGFSERRYDLVVASNILHATKSIKNTLRNVRNLLKPGGHLVLWEITDGDPVRDTFFFGTLPGWWIGEEDGRLHNPLLPQSGWDAALKEAGFSGIDTATPNSGIFAVPFSVMLSQSIDPQMQLIRQPLDTKNSNEHIKLPKLLVLSGHDEATTRIQNEVLESLRPFTTDVQVVTKLEDLEENHFEPKQLVLSLVEIHTNVFGPLTPGRWTAMQLMVEKSLNILWVTHGGDGENPFSNMIVGASRSLIHERPDLRFQIVDFTGHDPVDPSYIASTLMRMHISGLWKTLAQPYVSTWALEGQIRVMDGQVMVPRLSPCRIMDQRYNSSRRKVHTEVPLKESVVAVQTGLKTCELYEVRTPSWAAPRRENFIEVQTLLSTLSAVTVPSVGYLHVLIGTITGTTQTVLAFSETLQSKSSIPRDLVLYVDMTEDQLMQLLISAVSFLLASTIVENTATKTSLMVHEPTKALTAALKDLARDRHIGLSLTTSCPDLHTPPEIELQYIHPHAHRRKVLGFLPSNLSTFCYFPKALDPVRSAAHIEEHMQSRVRRLTHGEFFSRSAYIRPEASLESALQFLQRARAFFEAHSGLDTREDTRKLSLNEISGYRQDQGGSKFELVNFSAQLSARVALVPAEDEVQFRPDKTYWLAGLTGELGVSLTHWLIDRGARYVVLTSRRPNIDEEWLEAMHAAGATVRVLPMDITNHESVSETYRAINEVFPPIVGVCNGAMVLNDGLFAKQTFDDFNGTLEPKVKGTLHLDALFQKPDLDFFIVFSSLAWTSGNVGQTSYSAANGFMCGVVEGRRRRGLAGSVINLAGIYGIGYVTRREANMMDRLEKMGYSNISEWDYLQLFAEAVLAGRPDENSTRHGNWEITSAIRPINIDTESPPPWLEVPRFSWYRKARANTTGNDNGATISMRDTLMEQTTMEGVKKQLIAGFVANLYKLLGQRPEGGAISPSTPLIELGIDSLVAVDLRFWFTRELDLDLPVLKLLGGASVEDMVEDAVLRLSPALIPNVTDSPNAITNVLELSPDFEIEKAAQDGMESVDSGQSSSTEALDDFVMPVASTMTTPLASDEGLNEEKGMEDLSFPEV